MHKAIEWAELSRNDKKDHVSQMSRVLWLNPGLQYVCASVQDIQFVQYGMCILTDLDKSLGSSYRDA